MDSFNIPQYTASPSELEEEVLKEGSFHINLIKTSAISWNCANCYYDGNEKDHKCSASELASNNCAQKLANCMRAVAEPLLINHFGEAIIEDVFKQYQQILTHHMSKEKNEFVNVTISMTRKM